MNTRNQRQVAERKGQWSETLCAWFLRLKGYRILHRRFRCPLGEIDIVARKNRVIVFVEIKARPKLTQALEAVSSKQRKRIEAAADIFLQQIATGPYEGVRFDAIAVSPGKLPYHLKDAWRPEG